MWSTASEIATTVGTIIARAGLIVTLIISLRSERLTRAGQESEKRLAEASAERSEAAARLTEEYTRRLVDSLEQIAISSKAIPEATLGIEKRVKWKLEHRSGDTYNLINVGEIAAQGVQISTHESVIFQWNGPVDIGENEATTFLAVRTFGTSDSTVSVTWEDDSNEGRQTWKYPLPPKSE